MGLYRQNKLHDTVFDEFTPLGRLVSVYTEKVCGMTAKIKEKCGLELKCLCMYTFGFENEAEKDENSIFIMKKFV